MPPPFCRFQDANSKEEASFFPEGSEQSHLLPRRKCTIRKLQTLLYLNRKSRCSYRLPRFDRLATDGLTIC